VGIARGKGARNWIMKDGAQLFRPGKNCWRIDKADRLAIIVDAAAYFRALREVMIAARRELLLIGWDFDFEIEMLPGESDAEGLAPDGLPNQLGAFTRAVVERTPELDIYFLKWNGAVFVAPGRYLPALELRLFAGERIHLALDSHHPFGACHHQKIVVADDALAFCGGIDATEERWDTSEHLPDDPLRTDKHGRPTAPWHDATSAMTGPAAHALGELARMRWARATGDELPRPEVEAHDLWPASVEPNVHDVDVAIARTEPPFDGAEIVDEIERLSLDIIASARRHLYIESQYFACKSVCDAIEARLGESDGPEVVVVNPQAALTWLEDEAMHVLRGRLIERLEAADPGGRFRIYHPATSAGEPIYVHAKILIADDRVLRIGSSNIDARSMGFDTECDVAFEGGGEIGAAIESVRVRLLAEHLGRSEDEVRDAERESGSVIGAIEALNAPQGRGLRRIVQMPETAAGTFLANTRIFDPRYRRGERTHAGQGVRPRVLAVAAGLVAVGLLAWLARKKVARSDDEA
jgi:phospholipase D1/2